MTILKVLAIRIKIESLENILLGKCVAGKFLFFAEQWNIFQIGDLYFCKQSLVHIAVERETAISLFCIINKCVEDNCRHLGEQAREE